MGLWGYIPIPVPRRRHAARTRSARYRRSRYALVPGLRVRVHLFGFPSIFFIMWPGLACMCCAFMRFLKLTSRRQPNRTGSAEQQRRERTHTVDRSALWLRDETWPERSRTLRCALRPAVAPGSAMSCVPRRRSAVGVRAPHRRAPATRRHDGYSCENVPNTKLWPHGAPHGTAC